jgi:Zn-dependent protease with chaperone function
MPEPNPDVSLDQDRGGRGLGDWGWLKVYLLHLVLMLPSMIVLFLLVVVVILLGTLIGRGHANDTLATILAYAIPLGFLTWATSGIWLPLGAGRYMADGVGARAPTSTEMDSYQDAIDALNLPAGTRRPKRMYVLDDSSLNAFVLADTIVILR